MKLTYRKVREVFANSPRQEKILDVPVIRRDGAAGKAIWVSQGIMGMCKKKNQNVG